MTGFMWPCGQTQESVSVASNPITSLQAPKNVKTLNLGQTTLLDFSSQPVELPGALVRDCNRLLWTEISRSGCYVLGSCNCCFTHCTHTHHGKKVISSHIAVHHIASSVKISLVHFFKKYMATYSAIFWNLSWRFLWQGYYMYIDSRH